MMTVAIDDSRAKAQPSDERRRDALRSLSSHGMSYAVTSRASRHGKLCSG
jgi:hypothetical protein